MKHLFLVVFFSLSVAQAESLVSLGGDISSAQLANIAGVSVRDVTCHMVGDIPGTYICLAENGQKLRDLMGRASFYAEGAPAHTIVSASDSNYLHSAQAYYLGHDVMAKDFERFFRGVDEACKKSRSYCANSLESGLRRNVIGSAHKRGFKNYVVIAAVAGKWDTSTVISHELYHARFFLSSQYQKLVNEFWTTHVSESDRRAITRHLSHIYNLRGADGGLILINEFQAYVLQEGAMNQRSGPLADYAEDHGRELRAFLGKLVPPQ